MVLEIKNARIAQNAGVLLEGSAPSRTASSPAGASASQRLGRHGAHRPYLERHGPFLKARRAYQPFRFRAAALRARRTRCFGARHVFEFMRTCGAVKIVHGHKDISLGIKGLLRLL